ncbi:MAG: double-strand break repair protein AddB, partial [Kiloniellales bacterium]
MSEASAQTERPPAVYSIPAAWSFVDVLARGLLARWSAEPLDLASAMILLPTRRACRALVEAFLRASGGRALVLPRLVPLGDLDAEELLFADADALPGFADAARLPPAMPPLRRQLLLSQLILKWAKVESAVESEASAGRPAVVAASEDQAVRLAAELGRLLDQVETEGLGFDHLADLVPADYADHWQLTLRFLKIVTEQWPKLLASEGCIGTAERRRRLLEAQAEAWRHDPPDTPVLVAGSTGSIPATAALIEVVARLPRGQVVLPGLDRSMDAASWAAARGDPVHPQHGLAQLLARLGVEPAEVPDWPDAIEPPERRLRAAFIDMALRPAESAAADPAVLLGECDPDGRAKLEAALAGLRRIDCAGPGEEAAVVALILRQALQVPGRTAALVTPDRALARRVAAELRRWGIEIDDSAGLPLGETAPGTFLRLTASMIAERLAPLPLLAALKHPLAAGGRSEGAFRARVRALEIAVLRGPRPAPGFAGLRRALEFAGKAAEPGLVDWLGELERMAADFIAALDDPRAGLAEIVTGHIAFAEALAASEGASGAARLWDKEAGEAAADFMAELRAAAASGPPLRGERYPALLAGLLSGPDGGGAVRPRHGSHPRLAILGPLEARLQHADVTVLSGLNEGTWPAETNPGPWLSRPMRADFGLPPVERRIGLSAHDFTQACAAPEVYLTRATRVEGTPSVPSRWLLRIDALLRALGPWSIRRDALQREGPQWRTWAATLDRPVQIERPGPPAPCPPLAARPRRLSVTQVETWMRDPYALYAAKILKLQPLDPLDADPGAAERGTLIHRVLERYVATHPEAPPADAEAALIELGRVVFAPLRAKPGLHAFWWPRFERIARWFAGVDAEQRRGIVRSWAEVRGAYSFDAAAGSFTVTATADRIDLLRDGGLAILDYKTGALPTGKDLALGFSPQLPLEAAMAAAGGFTGVPAAPATSLAFWRLTGGSPPGEIRAVREDAAKLAAEALKGLAGLVARFDDPATPYLAQPRPAWAPRYNDYLHLARVKEWAA